MPTAEEIRSQIQAVQRTIEEKKREKTEAQQQREQAIERQQLRRELERVQLQLRAEQAAIDHEHRISGWIDHDAWGPHQPANGSCPVERTENSVESLCAVLNKVERESTNSSVVAQAEYIWKIAEISWLVDALKQEDTATLVSKYLDCGGSTFYFQYAPAGGDEGSLAILHEESKSASATFRYKIFIKRRGGEFVQWGQTGNVCMTAPEGDTPCAFGPDVPSDGGAKQGIFGLSHKALVESEWVEDDSLTVRFELAVRLPIEIDDIPKAPQVEVPVATISSDLLSFLDNGKCSDVKISVEGETIHTHSLILCSRSEVFDKLLNGGMSESMSKEVCIQDCSARSFKAVLRFLYTDDFSCMDTAMQQDAGPKKSLDYETRLDQSSSSSNAGDRVSWVQSILAVSHKYALLRLQAWCEHKLCECISVNEVCSILCQANLYGAKQLINACLNFVKEHYAAVVVTEKFGTLAKEWPEVMLKINLCTAGVSEANAKPAIEASHRPSGKRKRDE